MAIHRDIDGKELHVNDEVDFLNKWPEEEPVWRGVIKSFYNSSLVCVEPLHVHNGVRRVIYGIERCFVGKFSPRDLRLRGPCAKGLFNEPYLEVSNANTTS